MDTTQSKSRLLLVDGDPKSLRVLDVSLKKAGFDVAAATSGREALALLEAGQPDLIISDTDLDEMDGFELCSRIKARSEWSKIPFLFVSGRKSIEDKIRGLELGVDDYLTKPIYIKEIGIRVRTALQRAERERMESRREGRTRFAGDLSDVGVVDLVQTIELNRKSGIIHIVNRDGRRGSIFFRDGKVVDAEVGRLSGANAMYRLFSWSEGQFAVEFKQIRRHDVIDTAMAPLLMEGMRRLDESAHLLEKLPPLTSVLEVDCRALAEELAELPDEMNSVLRLCDGTRTLQEIVEDSDHPDLEALTTVSKLFAGQIIFARESPDRGVEAEPSERLASWLSEGGAEDGAAADHGIDASESSLAQALRPDGESVPEKTPSPIGQPVAATDSVSAAPLATDDDKTPSPNGEYPPPEPDITKPIEIFSAEESLSAALPARTETGADGGESPVTGWTLKGIPIGNLFAPDEKEPAPPPPVAAEAPAVESVEPRSTKPLGLAERLLSEDSEVRASAMHEAVADDDGRVQDPVTTGRHTREYGDPEAALSLVDEVVSSSHEIRRDQPPAAKPARPTKEVDWGAWPTQTPPTADAPSAGPEEGATRDASGTPAENAASTERAISSADSSAAAAVRPEVPVENVPDDDHSRDAPVASAPQGSDTTEARFPQPSIEAQAATGEPPPVENNGSPSSAAPTPLPAATDRQPSGKTKSASGRGAWILVVSAFVLGATGYLVLGGKLAPAPPPPAPATVSPPPPAPAPPTKAVPSRGPAAKKAKTPLLGTPSPVELRRVCVETDDDGRGKAKAVAAACRQALEADPTDVDIMAILARAEIDRGRLVEAKSLAKKMLAADAKRFDAYVFLGTAEQEAGKIDDAKAAYRKYLELAPDGPFARELRAILNNL